MFSDMQKISPQAHQLAQAGQRKGPEWFEGLSSVPGLLKYNQQYYFQKFEPQARKWLLPRLEIN